jgi:ATP-binding cassette subfamily F protein uup
MATLVTLINGELAYGLTPLLDRADLSIAEGERIGLIGRNGTGKSTLLGVLAGRVALEDGDLKVRSGLRVITVEQEPVLPQADTLQDSLRLRGDLEGIHDERERWRVEARLSEYMERLRVRAAVNPDRASGGEKKRAALALALALDPDLLLLDEPTNHLDLEGIATLEELLQTGPAVLLVTHDRWFLDRVVTRIVELDRGYLKSFPGNFSTYQNRKQDLLATEAVVNRKFDKFWAQEEVWIRKGVEARRTRNEGRVRRLEALRVERAARREQMGRVKLAIDARERSGKLVAELTGVAKSFGGRDIVRDLDLTVMRGDRIGILGENGAGKSTLIRLILGQLQPDAGNVRIGSQLSVAYFDQMREQLDLDKSVAETLSPGSDWVEVHGERRHVTSYLADFLFPAQRAGTPVRALSGGERNRLLLARLFAKPANVLVLDEPTNDLDIDSLELLENAIQDFPGTLLLVSHDRAFVDNIVTQTLWPLGDGHWRESVGGYSDWLREKELTMPAARPTETVTAPTAQPVTKTKSKLSYKEERELAALPGQIEALEAEQRSLSEAFSAADYPHTDAARVTRDGARVAAIESELLEKLERWEALESEAQRLRGP